MEGRIAAESAAALAAGPGSAAGVPAAAGEGAMGQRIPDFLHAAFSAALGQSLLLPGLVAVAGGIVAVFFRRPRTAPAAETSASPMDAQGDLTQK
jgi:hypothetical protein